MVEDQDLGVGEPLGADQVVQHLLEVVPVQPVVGGEVVIVLELLRVGHRHDVLLQLRGKVDHAPSRPSAAGTWRCPAGPLGGTACGTRRTSPPLA